MNRRFRAGLVLGAVWGAAWAAAGVAFWLNATRHPELSPPGVLAFAGFFGFAGFAAGAIFARVVMRLQAGGVDRLPLHRAVGLGTLSGTIFGGISLAGIVLAGGHLWPAGILTVVAITATLSALCGGGVLAIAKRGASAQPVDPVSNREHQ